MLDFDPSKIDSNDPEFDDIDRASVKAGQVASQWEFAYNMEHATKTSSIGIVVSSSPVALLAW